MEEIEPTILHDILEANPVTICHFIQRSFKTQLGAVYTLILPFLFGCRRARQTHLSSLWELIMIVWKTKKDGQSIFQACAVRYQKNTSRPNLVAVL